MCGIFLSVKEQTLPETISRRGPTFQSMLNEEGFMFGASVLHLRGEFCPQPLASERYIFAFNGEVFDPLERYNPQTDNDTSHIFHELCKGQELRAVLSSLKGPFAFALYDRSSKALYFGRDSIGRRSLLWLEDPFTLSSVAPLNTQSSAWMETVPGVIYQYDIQTKVISELFQLEHPSKAPFQFGPYSDVDQLLALLEFSLKKRIHYLCSNSHPVNILFSGGIDSLLLACIMHRVLPPQCPIILLNVSFQNRRIGSEYESAPDRVLGRRAFKALENTFSERQWIFQPIDVSVEEYFAHGPRIYELSFPQVTMRDLSIAAPIWFAAKAVEKEHKVVFVGMGADELLGGYSRHRRCA